MKAKFSNFHSKKSTVLYHINFFQPIGARLRLILRYLVNNDGIKKGKTVPEITAI